MKVRLSSLTYRSNKIIIRYPTGLYEDAGQLPAKPSDSTSVTFTISGEDPLRPMETVLQLPIAEQLRLRGPKSYTKKERRVELGELVFSLTSSRETTPGSNRKLFETGEILNFTDSDLIEDLSALRVPSQIDIQHNTNMLDLEDIGLSEEEIQSVNDLSALKKEELDAQISAKRSEILNYRTQISEIQKKINETKKVISAISELDDTQSIVNKLAQNLVGLETERSDLISSTNTANSELEVLYQSLINVVELVR